jgi:hypothetical protein
LRQQEKLLKEPKRKMQGVDAYATIFFVSAVLIYNRSDRQLRFWRGDGLNLQPVQVLYVILTFTGEIISAVWYLVD